MSYAGRSLSLLDPTYASKYIPIIASVSEHQPPAWNSYFTDVHILVLLAPLGLIACFRPLTDASLFLVLYGVTAVYFSGVMVRITASLLGCCGVCCCIYAFPFWSVVVHVCCATAVYSSDDVACLAASLLCTCQVLWCVLLRLCHVIGKVMVSVVVASLLPIPQQPSGLCPIYLTCSATVECC